MYSESPGVTTPAQVVSDTSTPNQIAIPDSLPTPLATRGVRARLGFLRPYYSIFRANVIIHQISSVPFKTGEFGVRWRFKDVQIPREGQLLGSNLHSPHTPARGITPFIELDSYTVFWSYTLDVLLKIGIDRETAQMSPSPLKLVVLQRVNDSDPYSAPKTSRFGAVYLDLSQFVGHGSVQRWYLLRESKTNTTMKLTLEMEYVSGETRYIPPPLGRVEIRSVMELTEKDPPDPVRYERAQRELQEYLAKQMAEVIAEHGVESLKIEMLSRTEVEDFKGLDDQLLEESHFDVYEQSSPPLLAESSKLETPPRADAESLEEPDDELLEEFYFDTYQQPYPPHVITVEKGRADSHRSRTSSNSSYASARSAVSVSESSYGPYYRDDESLYSIASSRTAETDYGLYYRRMALSQSTIDSGRTAVRRSRSWTPSTVTITADSRRNSGSIGPSSLRL